MNDDGTAITNLMRNSYENTSKDFQGLVNSFFKDIGRKENSKNRQKFRLNDNE